MAAVTIGTSNLTFATVSEGSIGLVQSFSEARNIEKNEVRNNAGDIVAVGYYNATTSYSLSVALIGAYNVTAGAALAAAGLPARWGENLGWRAGRAAQQGPSSRAVGDALICSCVLRAVLRSN